MFLSAQFAFHRGSLDPGGRSGWILDLANSTNGWFGILLFLGIAAFFYWAALRAYRRLNASDPALALVGEDLRFHYSYRIGPSISLDEIDEIAVRQEVSPQLLVPAVDTLFIGVRPGLGRPRRRMVRIRSGDIDGGLAALRQFERTIAAKRMDAAPTQPGMPLSTAEQPGR